MSAETGAPLPAAGSPSTATRWAWPALGVILLAAFAGLAALWWTSRPPAEGDPAVTFARDMTAHHRQAVEMAILIRDRSQDAELRQMLLDVILTQQAQIGQMQGWLTVWGLPLAGSRPPMSDHSGHGADMPPDMGMASDADVESLRTLPLAEAEIKFLRLMILHHQGGVYMSRVTLDQTRRPEVVQLAESIILSQEKEISYMQSLLQARGQTP
jgi:uncharacterized protein (DUF305 family)